MQTIFWLFWSITLKPLGLPKFQCQFEFLEQFIIRSICYFSKWCRLFWNRAHIIFILGRRCSTPVSVKVCSPCWRCFSHASLTNRSDPPNISLNAFCHTSTLSPFQHLMALGNVMQDAELNGHLLLHVLSWTVEETVFFPSSCPSWVFFVKSDDHCC